MKNVINYYYDLFPKDIHQTKDYYTFMVENISYYFLPYKRKIEDIDSIYNRLSKLYSLGIYVHQILLNKMNQKVTAVNNQSYILLKIYVNNRSLIILEDILQFQKNVLGRMEDQFSVQRLFSLWTEKIDYFEYQVSQFGMNFPLIRESFNYFVGLSEVAISLLNTIDEKNIFVVYSHYRLKTRSTLFDLYNPLELLVDSRVRDSVEYFKDKSLYQDCMMEIFYYFKYQSLNKDEALLFFARFLFPTFYFDIYERVISKEIPEDKIKVAIDFLPRYERNVWQLYKFLKNYYFFPDIEWINQLNYSD